MSDKKYDNLDDLLARMREAFPAYVFNLQVQGKDAATDEHWARAFIQHDGVQIGRINFQPVAKGLWKVYGWKKYKPQDYGYEDCDAIFYQLDCWLETGHVIDMSIAVPIAKQRKQERIDEVIAKRASLPNNKRAKVSTGWIGELWKLVTEIAEAER